jgi:dynein heavy chain
MPGTLDHIRKTAKTLIPISPISQVIATCKALGPMLQGEIKNLEYLFVYALVWSVAGCLGEKDGYDFRKEFSTWWKGAWKTQVKYP